MATNVGASISRKLDLFARAMRAPTRDALHRIAGEILDDVSASRPGHGVPVAAERGGPLRDSGAVIQVSDTRAMVTFGNSEVDYALDVHEDLDDFHEIGEARYLTRGLDRWQPGASNALRRFGRTTDSAIRRVRAR